MIRRDFLRAGLGAAAVGAAAPLVASDDDRPRVMTVLGPIEPGAMGLTLPHEHVLVDFAGAGRATPDRYDADEVSRVALPHLERARELGCRTLLECTPAYLARDAALLRRLAEASGLHILTNTGYYAANGGKHLPDHARTESADRLAARWLREWRDGIGETGVRPGFLKIGVDRGPLKDVERTLIRAAARAHRESGLTIAVHTGDGRAAMEQLAILDEEGVDPSAWVWVHAQNEADGDLHARAAERGGWVEFDGIAPDSVGRHVGLVEALRRRGHLGRILVSHDAGWYHVGEPGGGAFRSFETLFTAFLPALRASGFDEAEVRRLTVENPAEAFAIRARRRRGG